MTLQTRRLGSSGLEITTVGFGAWAVGGAGWAFSWGPQDDDQSIKAIRRAVAGGVNWIDTAAIYGLGHSEEVVARALAGIPATIPWKTLVGRWTATTSTSTCPAMRKPSSSAING